MEQKIQIVCSSCDQSFEIDEAIDSGFCLHCGTAFKRSRLTENPESPVSTADRIREIYDGYIQEMEQLTKKKPRTMFESLMGRDSYGTDAMHGKNRDLLISAISEYAAELASSPDADGCIGVLQLFLRKKDIYAQNLFWPLVACEQLVEPLLEHVPVLKLTDIYLEYCNINPSNQSLPNQLQLKKSMAAVITSKGGDVPKTGFFSRKRDRKEKPSDKDSD